VPDKHRHLHRNQTITNTVEPRYIEVQGTSSKCSIYPEFDISAL